MYRDLHLKSAMEVNTAATNKLEKKTTTTNVTREGKNSVLIIPYKHHEVYSPLQVSVYVILDNLKKIISLHHNLL